MTSAYSQTHSPCVTSILGWHPRLFHLGDIHPVDILFHQICPLKPVPKTSELSQLSNPTLWELSLPIPFGSTLQRQQDWKQHKFQGRIIWSYWTIYIPQCPKMLKLQTLEKRYWYFLWAWNFWVSLDWFDFFCKCILDAMLVSLPSKLTLFSSLYALVGEGNCTVLLSIFLPLQTCCIFVLMGQKLGDSWDQCKTSCGVQRQDKHITSSGTCCRWWAILASVLVCPFTEVWEI